MFNKYDVIRLALSLTAMSYVLTACGPANGSNGVNGANGADGTDTAQVSVVPLCPNGPSPSEQALCVNKVLYRVTGTTLSVVPINTYIFSNAPNSCQFIRNFDCDVSE
jgi:hypothetical protein